MLFWKEIIPTARSDFTQEITNADKQQKNQENYS